MNKYVLSIIIVTYNAEKYIRQTLDSIIKQKNDDIELIIIDGKSDDCTLKICNEYKDYINVLSSEEDLGIYDAMNKGIRISSGKYVYFIGAGDTLLADSLPCVINWLKLDYDIVYGRCYFVQKKKIYGRKTSLLRLMFENIPHQGMFIKKENFKKIGMYNLKYIALADWWWNIAAFDNIHISKQYIPVVIANYAEGGFSEFNRDAQFKKDKREYVIKKYGYMLLLIIVLRNALCKLFSILRK